MSAPNDRRVPLGQLDEPALQAFAAKLARVAKPPLVIYLQGELGAGKTTFTRAFIQALGYTGRVKSPTYGLLESYAIGSVDVLHLDLYRIADAAELEFLGIADLFGASTFLLVEWPDRAGSFLPAPDVTLALEHHGTGRNAMMYTHSDSGNALVDSCLNQGE